MGLEATDAQEKDNKNFITEKEMVNQCGKIGNLALEIAGGNPLLALTLLQLSANFMISYTHNVQIQRMFKAASGGGNDSGE